jgi:Tectonin domain
VRPAHYRRAACSAILVAAAFAGCSPHAASVRPSSTNVADVMKTKPPSVSPARFKAVPMTARTDVPRISSSRAPRSAIAAVSWNQVSGTLTFVAASPDGTLWGLGTSNDGSNGYPIYHYVNGSWVYTNGSATRLAVGPDGTPWAVNAHGNIFTYAGGSWNGIAGGASDITVASDGSVYVVSSVPGGPYGNGIWHYTGGTWTQLTGAGTRLSASWDTATHPNGITPGGFYLLNALGSIYYYSLSAGYLQQTGTASEISATTHGGYFTLSYPPSSDGEAIVYTDVDTGTSTTQSGAGYIISATDPSNVYVIGRNNALYQSDELVTGTLVWQTGSGSQTGQATTDVDLPDGQCESPPPVVSGNDVSFTVLRNTAGTYVWPPSTPPKGGASTCWRNQMNPIDASTGTNWMFTLGAKYTFLFQTVVTLNGNTAFVDPSADGGLAVDIPAILWQTHGYSDTQHPNAGPCDTLVIDNTWKAYYNGVTKYGTVSQPGNAVWGFHTCDDASYGSTSYLSSDFIYDGEADNWRIDVTAQIGGQSGGSVVVRRNGVIVYNQPSHVCDSYTPKCWWNFGPYMFYWDNSEEPPGWNNNGVTVQFKNMRLYRN